MFDLFPHVKIYEPQIVCRHKEGLMSASEIPLRRKAQTIPDPQRKMMIRWKPYRKTKMMRPALEILWESMIDQN